MGASQPQQIQVTVNVNMDPNNITNSVNKDNDNVAPPPISPFTANVQAKGEDGKEIPCNIVLNQNSINNYEQNSTNPSDLSESNTSNNIDNNMPRNRDKNNQTKNPQKNDFSIFNKENSAEINKINDDEEIDKNIDVNKIKYLIYIIIILSKIKNNYYLFVLLSSFLSVIIENSPNFKNLIGVLISNSSLLE